MQRPYRDLDEQACSPFAPFDLSNQDKTSREREREKKTTFPPLQQQRASKGQQQRHTKPPLTTQGPCSSSYIVILIFFYIPKRLPATKMKKLEPMFYSLWPSQGFVVSQKIQSSQLCCPSTAIFGRQIESVQRHEADATRREGGGEVGGS